MLRTRYIRLSADRGMQTVPDDWGPSGPCPRCGAAWEEVTTVWFRMPLFNEPSPLPDYLFVDIEFQPKVMATYVIPCAALVMCCSGHPYFVGPRGVIGDLLDRGTGRVCRWRPGLRMRAFHG